MILTHFQPFVLLVTNRSYMNRNFIAFSLIVILGLRSFISKSVVSSLKFMQQTVTNGKCMVVKLQLTLAIKTAAWGGTDNMEK